MHLAKEALEFLLELEQEQVPWAQQGHCLQPKDSGFPEGPGQAQQTRHDDCFSSFVRESLE